MTIGAIMRIFTLNLSFILHFCVCVATMVVSLINDKLSPKKEPPTTIATMNAVSILVLFAIPTATGVRAAIVPTDVPIDSEIKHAARNIPGRSRYSGITLKVKLTVASIAPISFADCANAPASRKIQTISKMLELPAPLEKISMRFAILPFVISMA